jgi:hypothetical protein
MMAAAKASGLRRQRRLVGGLAADQVAAHRDQGLAAVRPQRRDDAGRPGAPVEAAQDGLFNPSASISAMTSAARAACWPLRGVSPDRKRVIP